MCSAPCRCSRGTGLPSAFLHPGLLGEVANALARPLSALFERLWRSREVQNNWRKANVALTFGKAQKANPGATYQFSLTGKIMKQVLLNDTPGKEEGVDWEQLEWIYEGDIMTTVTGFGDGEQ